MNYVLFNTMTIYIKNLQMIKVPKKRINFIKDGIFFHYKVYQ